MSYTLYKANCISGNCRFERYAIDSYLSTCESLYVDDSTNEVQPNIPFYITSNLTLFELREYNYLTFTFKDVKYYALIVDILPISGIVSNEQDKAVSQIVHTLDIVACYGTGLFDNGLSPVIGNMQRGHVNDLKLKSNPSRDSSAETALVISPTCRNYLATQEEAVSNGEYEFKKINETSSDTFNEFDTKKVYMYWSSDAPIPTDAVILYSDYLGYLYIYIANPNEILAHDRGVSAESGFALPNHGGIRANQQIVGTQGIILMYPVVKGTVFEYTSLDIHTSVVVGYRDDTYVNGMMLTDITNSAITAMWFSKTLYADKDANGEYNYVTFDSTVEGLPDGGLIVTMSPRDAEFWFSNPIYFNKTALGKFDYSGDYSTDFLGNKYYLGSMYDTAGTEYSFSTYIERFVVKAHSAPYCVLSIEENIIYSLLYDVSTDETAYTETHAVTIPYIINCDLSSFIVIMDGYANSDEYARTFCYQNMNLFAPTVALDYWTRLNATQEGIQAKKAKTSAIISGITGTIGGITQIATSAIGINTGTNLLSSANGARTQALGMGNITGGVNGIVAGASTIASSISNAVYDVQYYNNAIELAEHQYNTGDTTGDTFTGFGALWDRSTNPAITCVTLSDSGLKRVSWGMHLQGYDCDMPLNLLYFHRRELFNFIRSSNYTRLDMPTSISKEFMTMFANGVWIFHSTPTNTTNKFEQRNLPVFVESADN